LALLLQEKGLNVNIAYRQMNYEIRDDHIGIFYNAFDEKLIDRYLSYYHHAEKQGVVLPRNDAGNVVKDHSIDLIGSQFWLGLNYTNQPFIDAFFSTIYPVYCKKYSLLETCDRHTIYDLKLQKTQPGEGYHIWHIENESMKTRSRLMAVMVYLNDVEEGGETEFLYQKCRFKAKKNTLLIWPAAYTHVHRGNPPLSGDKYVITGWIEYGI
tara:strand:- start:2119 stop:2751 length:633 start_codon:yes stop_codon:yes gene_type:complete